MMKVDPSTVRAPSRKPHRPGARPSISDDDPALAPMPHVLREYSLLADGERGAIIGPHGEVVWLCFPRWDSPAIFSTLIGGSGGYAITPCGPHVWGGYYEAGTLIWRSRWVAGDAVIECREALTLPSESDSAVLLRRLLVTSGSARVRAVLSPRAEYGRQGLREPRLRDDGVWSARTGDVAVLWMGAPGADVRPDGLGGRALHDTLELEEGATHDFVLVLACGEQAPEPPNPDWAWEGVESEWRKRVPSMDDTVAPRDASHAYAVMAGLTAGAGGMVAAATTSLPERAREGRSFDYRYVWIRDQCYAGQAVARAGPHELMDRAVAFVSRRLLDDRERMMPAYTCSGERVPDEGRLQLAGYPGGSDVVGNWVNRQFQLDAFGEALLLFAAAARHDHLDSAAWRATEIAAAAIEERWREDDAGVWELEPDAWTHSRLICAAGLRACAGLPQAGERAPRWLALADRIVSDTASHALHPSGRWQRSPRDERVDASLLMPAIRGALPADDPRSIATLRAVEKELTVDGYCYRYRPDERPLGQAEGAFLLCCFWMALAYEQQGELFDAARWFERTRAACGTPGLFAEEFDVTQRQLRGNLPQAFVHALLLECACSQAVAIDGGDGRD
jgi:hypothetical protein